MTSPLRMGNGPEREEPGIIILGDLDEVCLHREQNGHQYPLPAFEQETGVLSSPLRRDPCI